ncbi:hypothetical protein ABZP36_007677 [Zizania latifolia]
MAAAARRGRRTRGTAVATRRERRARGTAAAAARPGIAAAATAGSRLPPTDRAPACQGCIGLRAALFIEDTPVRESRRKRSGRNGRAGKNGTMIVMYNYQQSRAIWMVENDVGCKFTEINVEGSNLMGSGFDSIGGGGFGREGSGSSYGHPQSFGGHGGFGNSSSRGRSGGGLSPESLHKPEYLLQTASLCLCVHENFLSTQISCGTAIKERAMASKCSDFLWKGHVYSCYKMMIQKDRSMQSMEVPSSGISVAHIASSEDTSMGANNAITPVAIADNKRKRNRPSMDQVVAVLEPLQDAKEAGTNPQLQKRPSSQSNIGSNDFKASTMGKAARPV